MPEMIWELEGGMKLTGDDVYRAYIARAEWYRALLTQRLSSTTIWFCRPPSCSPFQRKPTGQNRINGRAMDTYHRWMEIVIMGTLSGCPVINVRHAGFSDTRCLPMGLDRLSRLVIMIEVNVTDRLCI